MLRVILAMNIIPVKAQELLDEAGWKDTNGNGTRDKDGTRNANGVSNFCQSTTVRKLRR